MYHIDISQMDFIFHHQRAVLAWIQQKYGICLVVTSLYRIGDSGVHGQLPLRGTDLRCWDTKLGKRIEADVNSHWSYDHERPELKVALYHRRHLHIQTHENTKEL